MKDIFLLFHTMIMRECSNHESCAKYLFHLYIILVFATLRRIKITHTSQNSSLMVNFLSTMIPEDWLLFWKEEQNKLYLKNLLAFLEQEYSEQVCYPAKHHIFKALEGLRPVGVKCILLGQDPYHGFQQATGLPFPSQTVSNPSFIAQYF